MIKPSWITRKDAILANPAGTDLDAEQGRAAQLIVRIALRRHSCQPLKCEDPRHDTDMADASTVAQALGIIPTEKGCGTQAATAS